MWYGVDLDLIGLCCLQFILSEAAYFGTLYGIFKYFREMILIRVELTRITFDDFYPSIKGIFIPSFEGVLRNGETCCLHW